MSLWDWLFRRRQRDEELEEEVQSHLRMAAQDHSEQGESAEQARMSTAREFGNVLLVKETTRDIWGLRWLETLLQDLRYGLRQLCRNPAFTAVAVITLALGIGANTAIFSFLDAALDLSFPIRDQGRIVNLWGSNNSLGANRSSLSIPDFLDYRQQNRVFEDLAAFAGESFQLTNVAEPKSVSGNRVSLNYFHVLGVEPAAGRDFLPEDSEGGKPRVVILSHGLWETGFGAHPAILGRDVTLNRQIYTVIGVMPAGFRLFNGNADLWVPLDLKSSAFRRGTRQVMVIGRLKPGVSNQQAQAEIGNLAQRLAQAFPGTNNGWDVRVVRLQDEINKRVGLGLVFIMGPVALVLLIACSNVANLLLARASGREKEVAVRRALGAGRFRLARQLLTESMLLAVLAGAIGLLLGIWGMGILRFLLPAVVNGSSGVPHVDAKVLGFAALLCILTPLVFGLAPALRASKLDINEALKEGRRGRRASGSNRLREYLVVSEVGFAVVLLGLGGLLTRVMLVLGSVKPPFDPKNVITMTVSLSKTAYPHDSDVAAFYRRVLAGAQAIPGVESIGITDRLPVLGEDHGALTPVALESQPGSVARASAIVLRVSPGYFPALGIRQLLGRTITEHDLASAAPVALINETLANSWRGVNPIGKRLRLENLGPDVPLATIVGVLADGMVDHRNAPLSGVYLSYAQYPAPAMTFVVRTLTPARFLEPPLKRALWAVDKDQPIGDVRTLAQIVSDAWAGQRAILEMLVAFAALALVLASAGVSSVTSYAVAQRTHEFGVRMSLGARPRDIVWLVMKEGTPLIASGVVVGLAGAFALGRFLGHELGEIRPYDPLTFSGVSLLLMAVALLASYLPARRATKVDPMVALRYE